MSHHRVFDCFTYMNEEMLLDLRMQTLDSVVDYFVVVESTHTFTGYEKPLYFDISKFPNFKHKIIHVVVDDMPYQTPGENVDPWVNERFQRNAIMRGLKTAKPYDRVIVADVDEIPTPEAILQYKAFYLAGELKQKVFHHFFNMRAFDTHKSAEGVPLYTTKPKITCYKYLQQFFQEPEKLRMGKWSFKKLKRIHYKLRSRVLSPGGWHFSWLMTPEEMIQKLKSFSHSEFLTEETQNVEFLKERIKTGEDLFGRPYRYQSVEIDGSFPEPFVSRLDQYNDWVI